MNRLRHLEDAGVSIWLDDLSRELIDSGEFMRLVQEVGNRSHFDPDDLRQGDQGSERYERQLQLSLESGFTRSARDLLRRWPWRTFAGCRRPARGL